MVPDIGYNSWLVLMGVLKSAFQGPGNEIQASEVDYKSRELEVTQNRYYSGRESKVDPRGKYHLSCYLLTLMYLQGSVTKNRNSYS